MKNIIWLTVLLLTASCKKREVFTMNGEIGKGLKSTLDLEIHGKEATGKLFYIKNKNTIIVKGNREGAVLTLYEYDKNNKINGVFVGTFDNSQFVGTWSEPKGKSSASFKYQVVNRPEKGTSKSFSDNNNEEKEKINKAYLEWVQKQVKAGEYWTESKWTKKYEPYKDNWDNLDKFLEDCTDALPDTMNEVHYGDINGDKILDAWAYIVPIYCSPGTWQIGVRHLPIFILSNGEESYSVLAEPENIGDEIGTFGAVDTIFQNGVIVYEGRDYGDSDARCCPSKTWKVKFKYSNGRFIKI